MRFNAAICCSNFYEANELAKGNATNYIIFKGMNTFTKGDFVRLVLYELKYCETKHDTDFVFEMARETFPDYYKECVSKFEKLMVLI